MLIVEKPTFQSTRYALSVFADAPRPAESRASAAI